LAVRVGVPFSRKIHAEIPLLAMELTRIITLAARRPAVRSLCDGDHQGWAFCRELSWSGGTDARPNGVRRQARVAASRAIAALLKRAPCRSVGCVSAVSYFSATTVCDHKWDSQRKIPWNIIEQLIVPLSPNPLIMLSR
jgi:hypothetical protein